MSCLRSCSVGSECPSIPATLPRGVWEAWGGHGDSPPSGGCRLSGRVIHTPASVFATYCCERCLFFPNMHFCCMFSSTHVRVPRCACVQTVCYQCSHHIPPEGRIPQAMPPQGVENSSWCLPPARSDSDLYFYSCPQ